MISGYCDRCKADLHGDECFISTCHPFVLEETIDNSHEDEVGDPILCEECFMLFINIYGSEEQKLIFEHCLIDYGN